MDLASLAPFITSSLACERQATRVPLRAALDASLRALTGDEVCLTKIGADCDRAEIPLDHLLSLVGDLTARVFDLSLDRPTPGSLSQLVTSGNRIVRDLIAGYHRTPATTARRTEPRDLVGDLLHGNQLAPGQLEQLAEQYTILAVRNSADTSVAATTTALRAALGHGVLIALTARGGAVLIPNLAGKDAVRHAATALRVLDGQAWIAFTVSDRNQVRAGWQEASQILTLVLASHRPLGHYRRDDVLVELAVATHPTIADSLSSVITSLATHPTLRTTLVELIKADGKRARACENLIIHRSTLDHRLSRITQITGYDPASTRGLQVLNAGLTTHTLTANRKFDTHTVPILA